MSRSRVLTCRACGEDFECEVRSGTPPNYCSATCRSRDQYARAVARRTSLAERRCARCEAVKPTAEFAGMTHPYCRPCHAAYAREARANWTPDQKEARRRQEVAYRYGVTVEHLDALLEFQGRRCAICRVALDEDTRHWTVDHDHACCSGTGGKGVKTGRPRGRGCGKCVRGILCGNCNGGLGYFRDDPAILRAAVKYLTRSAARARRQPA